MFKAGVPKVCCGILISFASGCVYHGHVNTFVVYNSFFASINDRLELSRHSVGILLYVSAFATIIENL
jgi:hypothetical protein